MRTGDIIRFILSAALLIALAWKGWWDCVAVLAMLWIASEAFTFIWRYREDRQ